MRRKAHEACNYIYFPGTHPSPGAVVHFRFIYPLKHSTTLSVRATGSTKFHLNGKIFARIESSHSDRHLTLSDTDTQPHNTLNAIVTPLLGAAMLCLSPQWVTSQVKAECSHDGRIWVPAVATPIFKAPEFQEHAVYPIAYDNHTADFGSNILGIPEFTVSGKGTIQLFPGESLLEAQNANPHHCEQATPVFNVSGTRTIEGPELALQFLRIQASPSVKIKNLHLKVTQPHLPYTNIYESSDPLLNQIWAHSAYTLKICTRELLVDGIKRDRLPWSGDVYIATLSDGCVFNDHTIAKRTALAIAGNPHPGGDHVNGISDYTFWWLLSVDELYNLTHDKDFLRQAWPCALKMIDFLQSLENKQGFIEKRPIDWLFLDWAPLEKNGVCGPLQMIYVMALDAASRLALESENLDLSTQFLDKTQTLRAKIREHFWNSARQTFVDALIDGKQSDAANPHAAVFAVLSGVASPAQRKICAKRLADPQSHTGIGTPYMRFFLGLALARLNEKQAMVDMIKSYWGGMLAQGATTFWEAYDPANSGHQHYAFYGRPFGKSLCHAWAAGPVYLLSKALNNHSQSICQS